jgi:VRR-NUC domain
VTETKAKYKVKLKVSEHQHQCAYFRWFAYAYPKKLAFAIPNGGNRSAATGEMLKKEGVKAGIPDILVASVNGKYAGLFIEMKAESGRVSLNQQHMIDHLESEGYKVKVCRGWEAAKIATEKYFKNVT